MLRPENDSNGGSVGSFQTVADGLAGLILSRAVLALAHYHGWFPEKQIKQGILSLKKRVARLYRRRPRPPHVADAPGLVWLKHRNQWVAVWRARPDYVKAGVQPKERRLLRVDNPISLAEAEFISDTCVRHQADIVNYKVDKRASANEPSREPSIEEILASVRRIIADDAPQPAR